MIEKMQKQTPQISAYFAYFAPTLPTMHFTHTPMWTFFHTKCIKTWFQAKVYFSAAEPGDEKEENDSAQKLLETIYDIACSGTNSPGEIVKMLMKNVCFQCKRPAKKSEKCRTLQKVYHCECQPYFVIKNPHSKMVLSVESNPNRR